MKYLIIDLTILFTLPRRVKIKFYSKLIYDEKNLDLFFFWLIFKLYLVYF